MTSSAEHWDDRYRTVGSANVSWFQEQPEASLRLVTEYSKPTDSVVDIGGGASTLVDGLLVQGYADITVVDLSQVALDEASERLHHPAQVNFVQGDIREWTPNKQFALWHDRAVYHFLTETHDQANYWSLVRESVSDQGYVVIATFADDGPTMCSGLPVARYSPDELIAAMGEGFTPVAIERELHRTPSGGEQAFTWVVAQRT